MFKIKGYTSARGTFVEINGLFQTVEEANEIGSSFPKVCKAQFTKVNPNAAPTTPEDGVTGSVWLYAELSANKVNGGKNETGVKRINAALDFILDGEYDFAFVAPHTNSMTEAEIMDWLT
jgi:hypothetical protein